MEKPVIQASREGPGFALMYFRSAAHPILRLHSLSEAGKDRGFHRLAIGGISNKHYVFKIKQAFF